MFETDRLPDGWDERLNKMDVVMVPTEFSRAIFEAGGVYEDKLSVLGESVDSAFFDPSRPAVREGAAKIRASIASDAAAASETEAGRGVAVTEATFVMLSVFKWEERKGYKALFKVRAGNRNVACRIRHGFATTISLNQAILEILNKTNFEKI